MKAGILVAVAVLLAYTVALAEEGQSATATGGSAAVNAADASFVYIDNSKKTFNVVNRKDAQKIAELMVERKQMLAEIARLSQDEESQIIKRSRQELLDSLPEEIRAQYEKGNRQELVEYLEKEQNQLKRKSEKLSAALSKSDFELAVIVAEYDHSRAIEYLRNALNGNAENLAATALLIQLLSKVGQVDEAIHLIDGLQRKNEDLLQETPQSTDISDVVSGFYISAVGTLIDGGRFDAATDLARRGIARSITEKNRGNIVFRDLEKILILILDFVSIYEEQSVDLDNYAHLKSVLAKINYKFEDCHQCWGYMGVVASYNLILVGWAQSRSDTDVASLGFRRANEIMTSPGFPSSVWQILHYEFLLGVARGARLNGVLDTYWEYRRKAADHLRAGLDQGHISYERQLDLVDLELDEIDSLLGEKDRPKIARKLSDASFVLSTAIDKTKGYEARHIRQLLRLGDMYSLAGKRVESERIYLDVENRLGQMRQGNDKLQYHKLMHSFFASHGYHLLRIDDSNGAAKIAESWLKNNKKLKQLYPDFEESVAEEFQARVALLDGDCSKFHKDIERAISTFEMHSTRNNSQIDYANRLRRLLRLSTSCMPPGKAAVERNSRLLAYSDALFARRPWDSEVIDDIIYSINWLIASSIVADGGKLLEYYLDIFRNRMLTCARYKIVSTQCSVHAAYALGIMGNMRARQDSLLSETSIKEFQAIEKTGGLGKTSRELYITTLTLYSGALDFEANRDRYIELQREALRIYGDIPANERTESMTRWGHELQSWLNSGSRAKFSKISWLYFGEATFR